ncbi:MAG: hypothetical protein ACRD3P_13010 [Terriglobales bacterium]
MRDREGYEALRARGVKLGEHPYDLYTFETADDVTAIVSLFSRHRDSAGRAPCMVMSFCTANLDFKKMKAQGYKGIELLPLSEGLPGSWSRPGLLEAYRDGIQKGIFYPAMHGVTHFCPVAIENTLAKGGERGALLRLFWEAETPYIYWRMPWVGYEYWNPAKPGAGFLPADIQQVQIRKARESFIALFGTAPVSACAPGYFANRNTHRIWAEAGIRIAQNGPGNGLNAPYIDGAGILDLHRTIDFEPSHQELEVDKYLQIAGNSFARGLPFIISTHSINFHSTLKDFRTPTLAALDSLLTALEAKYPDLLYVHDQDLYAIVTEGAFRNREKQITVSARRQDFRAPVAYQGAM